MPQDNAAQPGTPSLDIPRIHASSIYIALHARDHVVYRVSSTHDDATEARLCRGTTRDERPDLLTNTIRTSATRCYGERVLCDDLRLLARRSTAYFPDARRTRQISWHAKPRTTNLLRRHKYARFGTALRCEPAVICDVSLRVHAPEPVAVGRCRSTHLAPRHAERESDPEVGKAAPAHWPFGQCWGTT